MTHIKVNAIVTNNNQYLLLKRSPEDGGFWQTLTGTVEDGENLFTTLQREAEEETGITDLTIDETPVHTFTWKKDNDDVVELVYLCHTKQRDVRLSLEHTDYMWADRNKAESIVEKSNNKIAVQKANGR